MGPSASRRGGSTTPADTAVEMNELVLPQHTNALGTAFGGAIISWIDVCAAMAAQRQARAIVVTASMDQIDFLTPIKLGHVVCLRASVNYVGRTSMEVGVRVETEDPCTGQRAHAASAYLTFVALDRRGRPKRVRTLVPQLPADKLRWREAEARRRQRIAMAAERRRLAAEHG